MVQIFFGYIVLVFISLCNCEDLPEIITAPQATSDVTGTENFGKKIGDDVVNFVDEIIPYSTEANGSEARHLCTLKICDWTIYQYFNYFLIEKRIKFVYFVG